MTFEEWIEAGVDAGWVSYPFCETHDGPAMTDDEIAEFDKGYDPCISVLRLWPKDVPAT